MSFRSDSTFNGGRFWGLKVYFREESRTSHKMFENDEIFRLTYHIFSTICCLNGTLSFLALQKVSVDPTFTLRKSRPPNYTLLLRYKVPLKDSYLEDGSGNYSTSVSEKTC